MKSSTILWFLNIGTVKSKRFLLLTLVLTRFTVTGKTAYEHFDQPATTHHGHQHNHHQHQHRHNHGSQSVKHHRHPEVTYGEDQILNNLDNLVNRDGEMHCVKCSSFDQDLFIKLKLEAIKSQILSKLQLKSQPNVTSNLPRELVLKALKESKSNLLHQGDVSSPSISSSRSSSRPSYSSLHSSASSLSSLGSSISNSHGYTRSLSKQTRAGDSGQTNGYNSNDNELLESSDDYYGTTSEIITFPEPGMKINGHTILELTPPNNNINSLEVTSASLWIQLTPWDSSKGLKKILENHKINVFIFAVRNISKDKNDAESINGSFTSSSSSNIYFDQIVMKKMSASPGWKQIEIASEIQRWFSSASTPTDKLSLMVDCSGCEGKVRFVQFTDPNESSNSKSKNSTKSRQSSSLSSASDRINGKGRNVYNKPSTSGSQFRPFLVINTKPKTVKRIKRDNLPTCDTDFKHCCKQSLYVNFTELGWDNWVIAPQGYYANYCYGDCTKPLKTPDVFAYYHAYIMDRLRQVNPYASISPCCAPTRLSAMSFIYIGPRSNIVKADLPKMIVEECGCA